MRPVLALVALSLCGGRALADASTRPRAAPPQLTQSQGAALLRLARQAMSLYLTRRIEAQLMPPPPELKPRVGRRNPAAVTLRRGGEVLAVEIGCGQELCTNVAAAAQYAMRSSRLPDRVDQKTLDALTVEVEVLSAPQQVEQAELPASFVPGLTGVAYFRGEMAAALGRRRGASWALPAAGYVVGLDAEGMRRAAMGRFRLTPGNASLPSRLAVFSARHYVGFSDGRAVELFRGKDLARAAKLDADALAAAAAKVGDYLLRYQDKAGLFHASGQAETLGDHLCAAFAVARLARRSRAARFAQGAAAAVGWACKKLHRADGRASVGGDAAGTDLRATALLALTLQQAEPDPDTGRLLVELHRGLLAELRAAGPTSAATRQVGADAAGYLALLALGDGKALGAEGAKQVADLRKQWGSRRPQGALGCQWAYRAGLQPQLPLSGLGGAHQGPIIRQAGRNHLPDELGGFAEGDREPSTVLTGSLAVCLSQAMARRGVPAAEGTRQLGTALTEARGFCRRMMYEPDEAYFAEKPDSWAGGVRASPGSAAVTLPACAAAIEAFLGQ
jgi:AMMECR1 domain-containing protein